MSRNRPPLVVAVVSDEVAALLAERDPPRRERLLADPAKLDQMPGRKKPPPARAEDLGFPWEGPRHGFALLLGESAVWAGPESLWLYDAERQQWVCRFCSHFCDRLPDSAACLGCDRTGKDHLIPAPTELDLKKRREGRKKYRKGKLKGGVA